MGQTMAEKIFSEKAGRRTFPGEFVTVPVDKAMSHDAFYDSAVKLVSNGIHKVWDPGRVIIVLDHFVPAPNEKRANVHAKIKEMAKRFGISRLYPQGYGICHQVMIEERHAKPKELIVGTDSHTCTYGAVGAGATGVGTSEMAYVLATGELWFHVPATIRMNVSGSLPEVVSAKDVCLAIAGRFGTNFAQYKAIEFVGDVAKGFSVSSRMVLSNMAVEFGAKFGFFPADEKTLGHFRSIGVEGIEEFTSDLDAVFEEECEIDVTSLEPLVAVPDSVDNVKPVREIAGEPIHQAFLGSCTNGRLEDLRAAAEILKGRKVADSTRLLVFPASRKVFRDAVAEGVIQILADAGALICPAACGPCFGGHGGVLGPGESCIASTNRNFKGRMGSQEAKVYLSSAATVAASAFSGRITDPRTVK